MHRSASKNCWPALALALIVLTPRVSLAQTRFLWPDTAVQVARYTNLDDCLAADERVRIGVTARRALIEWQDTMRQDPHEALKPLPPEVTQSAAQCSKRFTVANVDVHEFIPAMRLFLAAGRDSDAAAMVERRLAAVPVKNTIERGAVADTAVILYAAARPARLASAESLLVRRAKTTSDRIERFKTYNQLLMTAKEAGDSIRAVHAARMVVSVADSLTVAEKQSDAYERIRDGYDGTLYIYDALDVIEGTKSRLDSLRKSTAAYAALEKSFWSRATGERGSAMPLPIGAPAAPLTADFWYPETASSTPHPGRGHPTVVLFLAPTDCSVSYRDCTMRLAQLRRLATRYPTVEIDIVMATQGHFLYLPPTKPDEEAALMKQLIDAAHIPGAVLGVTTAPFWRLPAPDSRRINNELPNSVHYTFRKTLPASSGSLFLIDSDGTIANAWGTREGELEQFIDVLLQRQNTGTHP